jgi:hypothetical protein
LGFYKAFWGILTHFDPRRPRWPRVSPPRWVAASAVGTSFVCRALPAAKELDCNLIGLLNADRDDVEVDSLACLPIPELAQVAAAWSLLSEPIRRAVLALVGVK